MLITVQSLKINTSTDRAGRETEAGVSVFVLFFFFFFTDPMCMCHGGENEIKNKLSKATKQRERESL